MYGASTVPTVAHFNYSYNGSKKRIEDDHQQD